MHHSREYMEHTVLGQEAILGTKQVWAIGVHRTSFACNKQ